MSVPPTHATLGAISEERIPQTGPGKEAEFVYVDISSIDNKAKRIVEPKTVPTGAAPSRAKQNLKAGDVLVSMTRPNLNAVALVPRELDGAVGSTGFHVLRARDVEPSWLFHAVQDSRFIDVMCRVVQGALYPAVRPKDIRAFPISLPPRHEQQRIVAEIEKQFTRLEAGVAALRRVQANLKRYRAAILKAACEGRLVPTEAELARKEGRFYETGAQLLARILAERRRQWRGRSYIEPVATDSSELAPVPEGWVWSVSDALLSLVTSGSRGWAKYYSNDGPAFLRIGNLDHEDIRLDLNDIQRVTPPIGAEGTRTIVRANDILISSYYLCASHGGWGHFKKLQRGATKMGLGLDDIRAAPVPLPPLAEQKRIVIEVERRLSIIEELDAVVATNLQRATRLRQSILERAFSGRLCSATPE